MHCVCLGDDLFGECRGAGERDAPRSFVDVDGGETFSIGVTRDGDVVGWGSAFYGELGDGGDNGGADEPLVCRPPTAIRLPDKCRLVACGLHHVLAVSTLGEVHAWGRNSRGQTAQLPSPSAYTSRPVKIEFPTNEPVRVVTLAAGGAHSLALDSAGAVWSWGDNSHGQLGIGSDSAFESTSQRISFPQGIPAESIAAGYAHSAAVARGGRVFTFGWGLYHQLGHGTTEDSSTPELVDALDGIEGGMRAVACGTWHTAAISSQGDVYTWGWGPDGQLGPSQSTSSRMPAVVDTDDEYFSHESDERHAVHVACGARFTVVVSRAGDVFCWGRNGPSITSSADQSMKSSSIETISAGHSHVLIIASGEK